MIPALDIQAVNKTFGTFHALKQVSLQIEQGEFFALLGPNGAGKTTLISCLAGLSKADSGTLKVMGHDVVADYQAARTHLGVVPQELVFDPFFNVREALVFQSGYFGLKKNDDWIDEILENLGLTNKAHTNMRALSGGMKRRVMVAQALVHRPPVIVLDEPTAGVDVELRQSLWTFVRELNQKGHTIVLTTHYLEEAETLCNRIAMLKHGEIIALDTKENLLRGHASRTLKLELSAPLPETLQSLVLREDQGRFILRLNQLEEVESILAALRTAGITLKEMSIQQPDLEDVFIQLMHS